jgi:hypothetical protein
MKKLVVMVAVLVMATSAFAVLPVAQTAEVLGKGNLTGSAGFVLGLSDNESKILGARCTYGVLDNMDVGADVGYDLEFEVMDLAVFGVYALPFEDLPLDLALRFEYNIVDFEFVDGGQLGVLALGSAQLEAVPELSLFGGVGLTYGLWDDADLELMGTFGALYSLDAVYEGLSLFGELSYANENPALGVGAVFAF